MTSLSRTLAASTAMPTLLDALMRTYCIREWGMDCAHNDPRLLHSFTPAAEVALGYASEPVQKTARKAVESYVAMWWERTFDGITPEEREQVTQLALHVCEIYVHHLRCQPGVTPAEREAADL